MIGRSAHIARLKRQRRQRIAQLCNLVADGVTIKDAAVQIGIAQSAATGMWRQVRDELGWQAE